MAMLNVQILGLPLAMRKKMFLLLPNFGHRLAGLNSGIVRYWSMFLRYAMDKHNKIVSIVLVY